MASSASGSCERDALRTGRPQNEIKHTGAPVFEALYSDPLAGALHGRDGGVSVGNCHALAEQLDFSSYEDGSAMQGGDRPAVDDPGRAASASALHEFRPSRPWPPSPRSDRRGGAERPGVGRVRDFFAEPLPNADVIAMR